MRLRIQNGAEKMELGMTIRQKKDYYEILHRGYLISTADSEHEAEADIEEYERQVDEYIRTGNLLSQTVAILLR